MPVYKNKILIEKVKKGTLSSDYKYIKNFKEVFSVLLYNPMTFAPSKKIHFEIDFNEFENVIDNIALKSKEESDYIIYEIGEEIATCFIKYLSGSISTTSNLDYISKLDLLKSFEEYIKESPTCELYDFNKDDKNMNLFDKFSIKFKSQFSAIDNYEREPHKLEMVLHAIEKELFWMKEVEKNPFLKNKIHISDLNFTPTIFDQNNTMPYRGIIVRILVPLGVVQRNDNLQMEYIRIIN